MTEEPGVLGNLPRSRPGHRSTKRTGGASAKKPAVTVAGKQPGAQTAAPSKRRDTAARKAASPRPPRSANPAPATPSAAAAPHRRDPVGGAVRVAVKVADAYLKTAGDILRRIPGR